MYDSHTKKWQGQSKRVHAFISVLVRQRQPDLYEFKNSLVYIVSFRRAKVT